MSMIINAIIVTGIQKQSIRRFHFSIYMYIWREKKNAKKFRVVQKSSNAYHLTTYNTRV